MNISIVRRRCGFGMGGAEGYCANVASGLRGRGHRVTVVADESTLDGVPFERARVAGRGSILKNLSFFMESRMVLGRLEPSCVYGLSRIKDADFLRISDPLHAAWLDLGYDRGIPAFLLRHLSLRHSLLLWQERQSIRTCRYIITNSRLVEDQLYHYYRVMPEYVFTVYNGVDHDRFSPLSQEARRKARRALGMSQGETAILFAGSDIRRKGLFHLMEVLSRLDVRARLFVAGAARTAEAEALCSKLGITQQVEWLGFRMDMERLYQAADVFCLPTLYDPFANTVLEAMACGTPAITTRLNGAAEAMEPVCPELVTGPSDPEGLLSCLEYFMGLATGEKDALRQAVHERALEFSWDRHLDRLEGLFRNHCIPGSPSEGNVCN